MTPTEREEERRRKREERGGSSSLSLSLIQSRGNILVPTLILRILGLRLNTRGVIKTLPALSRTTETEAY